MAKKKVDSSGDMPKKMTAKEREDLLIENFTGIQHAMTNLSMKFSSLSDNITKLLHIFELSARNFMKEGKDDSKSKEVIGKMDALLNQNKLLAKGLVALEEKLSGQAEKEFKEVQRMPTPYPPRNIGMQNYARPPIRHFPPEPKRQGNTNRGSKPLPSS